MVSTLPTRPARPDHVDADLDDEAALVARARDDRQAFAVLYRRYADPVYRYCYRRLGAKEVAEDATSQVFLQALAALPRFRDGSFRSWLFAIAHNVTSNALRSDRPHRPLDDALAAPATGPSPEDLALDATEHLAIRMLLTRLPADQRHLLELRLAGLTDAEIGRALGRSHGAVRVAQHRAVVRLRAILGVGQGEARDV